jgi:hypothetical protein
MAPITLYGTPMLEHVREYPFGTLTGCKVKLEVCEDLYRSNREWQVWWPQVRRRAAYGVFLDHLGGWVARGTYCEVQGLLEDGKPVFWFNHGQPTDRFGFGPGKRGDWAYRYRRVGLGWGRPVRISQNWPLAAPRSTEKP